MGVSFPLFSPQDLLHDSSGVHLCATWISSDSGTCTNPLLLSSSEPLFQSFPALGWYVVLELAVALLVPCPAHGHSGHCGVDVRRTCEMSTEVAEA